MDSLLEIPPEVMAAIHDTLACFAIGGIISTGMYGITILQTYIYFRRYAEDSVHLKLLVGTLFTLDTLTASLVAYTLYADIVTYFLRLAPYMEIPWNLALENGVTVCIASITQCFFAHRLWKLSSNKPLAYVIIALSICALGPGIGITVHLFAHPSIFSLDNLQIRLLAGFANGLSVICDLVIAGGLYHYLKTGKSGVKSTDSMVDRLIMYAVNRGLLTAACQLGHMISTVAFPNHMYFLPFAFMQGKLYCNTLLATLNVRQSLRDEVTQVNLGATDTQDKMVFARQQGVETDNSGDTGTESLATIEFYTPSAEEPAQATLFTSGSIAHRLRSPSAKLSNVV